MARGAVEHGPPDRDQKGQIGPRALTVVQIFIQHLKFARPIYNVVHVNNVLYYRFYVRFNAGGR